MTVPGAKILVVDDDANALRLMQAALRKAGYEVTTANGGEEALRLFEPGAHQLVMLDVDMPDLSGYEVCSALRAISGDMLPIVMVTGMDDVLSVERCYDSGATDFIAKPIHWALIGHRVRHLLRGYKTLLELRTADARNAAVLEAIPDLLFEFDIDGRYIDYHSPLSKHSSTRAGTLIGKTVHEVLPADAARTFMAALTTADELGTSTGSQFQLKRGKTTRWYELSASRKLTNSGQKPHFIVLSRDITDRKNSESRIAHLAYFDSLTGLPNRQSFHDRVEEEIRHAEIARTNLAILFMDLDGFKNINDTMGHSTGDLILKRVAERLNSGLRPADLITRLTGPGNTIGLARLGGDEFTVLMPDIKSTDDAVQVANRIGQLMRQPFILDNRTISMSTSIGIAVYPGDGTDAATLLQHADTAMYHAKNSGRNNAQSYSASLTEEVVRRMELDASLRVALERDEFHLVYQPQVDVISGEINAFEALIRWSHPELGLITPLEFIPFAEENGMIEPIGHWVLQTACADAARWNKAGNRIGVAVNLSPVQFKNPDLLQHVVGILERTGLDPELLELEVTESTLVANTVDTRNTLQALREHGVRIALDDFGTGYSSLSYLSRMPITNLKIDRCFVHGLLDGDENHAIVRAVLAMAGGLGIRVTAEGVESIEQALELKAMDCDGLQGFFISHPVSDSGVANLLQQSWSLGNEDTARQIHTLANRSA